MQTQETQVLLAKYRAKREMTIKEGKGILQRLNSDARLQVAIYNEIITDLERSICPGEDDHNFIAIDSRMDTWNGGCSVEVDYYKTYRCTKCGKTKEERK